MTKLLREKNVRPEVAKAEVWKFIRGYEGRYEVSNLGRVRRCDRCVDYHTPIMSRHTEVETIMLKGAIMSQFVFRLPNATPFMVVNLWKEDALKSSRVAVHRAVAEAFVPNPKKCRHVKHINDDYRDNRASNLMWYNFTDVMHHSKQGKKNL